MNSEAKITDPTCPSKLKVCFFMRFYAEYNIMEIKSILIKDTTKEERKQIVEESFGNISASCDGCMAGLAEMYQEYIDGTKEIRDINMEFNAHYIREDLDEKSKRSCPM